MMFLISLAGLLTGGLLTSFTNRLEKQNTSLLAPLKCCLCDHKLTWIDVIPILSWLAFRGKCRYCKGKLSALYPIVELGTMGYCLAVYLYIPFGVEQFLILFLGLCVIALSIVDIRSYRIPNNLIVALGLGGVLWCFTEPAQNLIDVGILFLVGMGLKLMFEKAFSLHSLGYGDVKLMAISGLWIETYDIPIYLILSGLFGIATSLIWQSRTQSKIFPFAPSLSMSLLITTWWRFLA